MSSRAPRLEGVRCPRLNQPLAQGASAGLSGPTAACVPVPAAWRTDSWAACAPPARPTLGSERGPRGLGGVGPAWVRMVLPQRSPGRHPCATQASPVPSGAPRTSSAFWSASMAARTSSSTSTARCWPTACCTSSASVPSGEACSGRWAAALLRKEAASCCQARPGLCSAVVLQAGGGAGCARPRSLGSRVPGDPQIFAGMEQAQGLDGSTCTSPSPPGLGVSPPGLGVPLHPWGDCLCSISGWGAHGRPPEVHLFREIRNVELLKLRFGEAPMHFCEVMLKVGFWGSQSGWAGLTPSPVLGPLRPLSSPRTWQIPVALMPTSARRMRSVPQRSSRLSGSMPSSCPASSGHPSRTRSWRSPRTSGRPLRFTARSMRS